MFPRHNISFRYDWISVFACKLLIKHFSSSLHSINIGVGIVLLEKHITEPTGRLPVLVAAKSIWLTAIKCEKTPVLDHGKLVVWNCWQTEWVQNFIWRKWQLLRTTFKSKMEPTSVLCVAKYLSLFRVPQNCNMEVTTWLTWISWTRWESPSRRSRCAGWRTWGRIYALSVT